MLAMDQAKIQIVFAVSQQYIILPQHLKLLVFRLILMQCLTKVNKKFTFHGTHLPAMAGKQ